MGDEKLYKKITISSLEDILGETYGAGYMESYGEWRVTVYDVIFGELRFLIVTSLNYPNYIENQI